MSAGVSDNFHLALNFKKHVEAPRNQRVVDDRELRHSRKPLHM